MIDKFDFYLGVFLIMLAIVTKNAEIGPFASFEVIEELPCFGFVSIIAWWGTIIIIVLKLTKLLKK